jgi:CHRD domain
MPRSWLRPVLEPLEDRFAPAVFNVNSFADILNPPHGLVTLRSALAAANATAGSNTINLTRAGTYVMNLPGAGAAGGTFDIIPDPGSPANSTLTIRNTSRGKVVVEGNHVDRVFDINANQWFGGGLNGGMEVPFTSSTGIGSVTMYYSADTSTITFTGNFYELTSAPTTIELHFGGGGANGPVATDANGNPIVFSNVPAAVTGTIPSQTFAVNAAFVSELKQGIYVNILTSNFPSGEIRGELNESTPLHVIMSGFTIQNGVAAPGDGPAGSGGAIRDQGNVSLTLTNMVIANNSASADGGGVAMVNIGSNATWALTVNNSTITGNDAAAAGGGIVADGPGTVVINTGTVISGNTAVDQGGGVWLDAIGQASASLTMTGTIVKNNRALSDRGFGGGIGNSGDGVVSIVRSTIEDNFAGASGGGFDDQLGLGTLNIQRSLILDNFAAGNGGGIYEGGPLTTITSSAIDGNRTVGLGGGILAQGVTLNVLSTTVADNVAGGSGGGIELETIGTGAIASNIVTSTITGNTALSDFGADGGGIDLPFSFIGDASLRNDTINANFALDGGGLFWAGIGNLAIENCIIAGNSAPLAPDVSTNEVFLATPTGAQAAPPTTSPATGFIILLFNASLDAITIYGGAQGLTGTLTAATVEVNGSVATDVNGNAIDYTNLQAGTINASFPAQTFLLTPAFANALLAGNVTTTMDTTAFRSGEIRGQFIPQVTTTAQDIDRGGNLIGVAGAHSGTDSFTVASTHNTGTVAHPLDPLLGRLANNGGPTLGAPRATKILRTERLRFGSPAIGHGIRSGAPVLDERGVPLAVHGTINIGATAGHISK